MAFIYIRYALESIKQFKFSFASDVWSFGVTLFEMFSRGGDPCLISELEKCENFHSELVKRLERGDRYCSFVHIYIRPNHEN